MKMMKKNITVAVTVALMAFPLSSTLALANGLPNTQVLAATTTAPATTTLEVGDIAETAVAAYEAGPITTLAEVATAEGLKAAADTAVAAVTDVEAQTAFKLRVTNRADAIASAKIALQGVAAEAAVAAYEAGPITTLAEVTIVEDLKVAADTAVAAVTNVEAKTAFELRVTNRAEAIATAKTALNALVVDVDGNEVTPATTFSDLIDNLQLALSFDPARKSELNKRHALKKLAQAQKLMKDGDIEASQNSLNEYTDKIAKAQAFLLEVEKTDSKTAETLAKALVNADSNNIQVLSNLIDKLPPQAAQKLALNVVRSMEKAVTKMQTEDAKVLPATTPLTTPVNDKKILEKQAQVALDNFKKSLNQKGKIDIKELDQDKNDNEDKTVLEQFKPEQKTSEMVQDSRQVTQKAAQKAQSTTQSEQNHVTALPVKTPKTPTVVSPTENDRQDQNEQETHGNNERGGSQDHR